MPKRGKSLLVAFLITFLVLVILFMYGYVSFEVNRIYGGKIVPFEDWRSYIAFLASKVPFLKDRINYQPLRAETPAEYYTRIYHKYIEIYNQKIEEMTEKEKELEEMSKVLEARKTVVDQMIEEIQKMKEELIKERNDLESYKKQVDELINVLLNTDPRNLANALNSVDDTTLAVIFKRADPTYAGEFLESLSSVNPQKAARVMEIMVGVDSTVEKLEALVKQAEEAVKQMVERESQLFYKETYLKVLASALNNLSPDVAVSFLKAEGVDPETLRTILSMMDREKASILVQYIVQNALELLEEKR
ncbi:MotE family protein [Thermotoga sp. KOL6]|uniref:MotE family protein n=1 Tax=Thermotoga sp. KOL6 TaxID=126741 RepID=UPI000C7629EC|nr:hypothetical protein [Thermotoga sp. KOL6]PLV59372.1 hypothetical protein AS005_06435 [Thermotoga sp. KOL6]